jgi:hypothetical protein
MNQEIMDLFDRYKEFNNHVFSSMSIQELFNLRHEMLDLLNKFEDLLTENLE